MSIYVTSSGDLSGVPGFYYQNLGGFDGGVFNTTPVVYMSLFMSHEHDFGLLASHAFWVRLNQSVDRESSHKICMLVKIMELKCQIWTV